MDNVIWIVYKTTNVVNNKIYIGVHKVDKNNIEDNYIGCGVYSNKPSTYMNAEFPFRKAVKKYGPDKFKRETLKIFETEDDAYYYESIVVNADFLSRIDVYNVHLGGRGGASKNTKVYQYDLSGNFIKEWNSLSEAGYYYNTTGSNIHNSIVQNGSFKGFIWDYIKTDKLNISNKSIHLAQVIYQYDNSGNYITSYSSIKELSTVLNIPENTINIGLLEGILVRNYYFSTTYTDKYIIKERFLIQNHVLFIYDMNGNYITKLENSNKIKEFFNTKRLHDVTRAYLKSQMYKQYQIRLEYTDKIEPYKLKYNSKRTIAKYDLNDNLICIYDGLNKAKLTEGIKIVQVLNGKLESYKNFKYKYIN